MMQVNTDTQYDNAVNECREIFVKKTKDYGTSWRVYRTISIADQIYIKAKRIRNIQEKKTQRIEDDIIGEFKGILNYAVIGLIQLDIWKGDPQRMTLKTCPLRKRLSCMTAKLLPLKNSWKTRIMIMMKPGAT